MYIGAFHVLDCPVPLILGMEFLGKMRPIVDFELKKVAIKHCGVEY